MTVGLDVAVAVAVGEGVAVGAGVGVAVAVGDGVMLGVAVGAGGRTVAVAGAGGEAVGAGAPAQALSKKVKSNRMGSQRPIITGYPKERECVAKGARARGHCISNAGGRKKRLSGPGPARGPGRRPRLMVNKPIMV